MGLLLLKFQLEPSHSLAVPTQLLVKKLPWTFYVYSYVIDQAEWWGEHAVQRLKWIEWAEWTKWAGELAA